MLNYSHSSINLSFDVLYGLFRECPLYYYVDYRILCHCVTSLEEKNHILKCYIFGKSHQILVRRFFIFGTSLHCARKCTTKLYATYVARAWHSLRKSRSLNCQLISNSVIQIHSFCLARYYAGFILVVFSSYGRKSRRTRFLFDKINWFFFCSITCFRVHDSEYKHLTPCY